MLELSAEQVRYSVLWGAVLGAKPVSTGAGQMRPFSGCCQWSLSETIGSERVHAAHVC